VERVRKALEWGRNHRQQSAQRWAAIYGYQLEDAVNYLTNSISYEFDSAKHEAMKKYFHLLQDVHTKVAMSTSQP
jgi:hypothetical protein